jgi:glycosyltransferase involved in cell wall biosynthesis
MACGAAVVGSNVSSMPEVIGNAGLLVDPISVGEISSAIIKAVKQRASLGEKAIERAKLFTWEETAKLTHEAYEKVVAANK